MKVTGFAQIALLCVNRVACEGDVLAGRGSSASHSTTQYLSPKTQKFFVNGTSIPQVLFDVGESYAGLIPANNSTGAADQQNMFFWFFPTINPAGKEDIVIWFNGGPGCSSMEGFLQENGPFAWKPGTFLPTANAYSWHKLANVIWVEYPIGTGFSSGPVTAQDDDDAAEQFMVFWNNFVRIFDLYNMRIFITGESFAGVHVPYVGAAMIAKRDKRIYNVKGALCYDPVLPGGDLGHDQRIEQTSQSCGHDAYLQKYLSYPPPPSPFPGLTQDDCDVVTPFFDAVAQTNPCFNQYHVSDTCPIQWDILGYPNMPYVPEGGHIWFNQDDVRQTIHVPLNYPTWSECQGPVYAGSYMYNNTEHAIKFQTLIKHTKNIMIGSGLLDLVIPPNVTALAIQMLEWNGKQGFQRAPTEDFNLPPAVNVDIPNIASGGFVGSTHTERGLTHVTINLSGHMVPQYAPSAAFRHLEVLLGRVKSLSSGAPYSINISTSFNWPY